MNGLHDRMVSARLSEISQRPDAPFAYGGMGRGSFTRTRDVLQLYAGVKGSDFVKAADALLAEAERVRRFGFTATELDRARTNYLRGLEQRYAERDKTNSSAFAGQYVSSALNETPIVNIGDEQKLAQRFAPTVTLAELNALARASFPKQDRVVIVAAPEKPEITLPSRAEMLAVFDRPADASLTAYVDSTSDAPLVAALPTPGKVVSETKLPETGILEWRLSNGAKVLLKPSDFKRDEVLFAAQSPGGISLLPDTVVTQGELASMALSVGGLGTFNQTSLTKRLAGKRASVSAYISDTEQGLQGNASAKDIETLFQLAWLNISQPRADSSAFAALRHQARSALANQRNDPGTIFRDTVHDGDVAAPPARRACSCRSCSTRSTCAARSPSTATASPTPAHFTFFLVGSFDADSVRPLVERYLASLPAAQRSEKARDVGIRPPSGVVHRTVRAGIEPKAQNLIVFSGPCEYSIENRTVMSALRELMDIRLREVLREDKGGTYGAGVGANCSHIPYSNYRVSVQFGSAPERTEELTKEVFSVIESIKQGAVSDSNMTKIRELTIRGHETALKQNNRWLGAMMDADEDGRDQRDFLRTTDRMRNVTKEQIRDAARLYLRTDRYAQFTLLPAEPEKKLVP